MADPYIYNHSDIRRYLQQQMPPEEMHAFERAMMDDPFLSDALEGFKESDASLAGKHLQQIEEEILGTEKAKVIPIAASKTNWWRIAALFIVIAGAVTMGVLMMNQDDEKTALAKSDAPAQALRNDSVKAGDEPIKKEDIFPQKDLLAQNKKPSSPLLETKQSPEGSASGASGEIRQADSTSSLLAMKDESLRSAPPVPMLQKEAAPEMDDRAANFRSREFRGTVRALNGDPLPYANVRSNNNVNTMTDNKGNFTIKAPDSVIEVNVSSLGYASANKKMKSDIATNEIVLNQESSLSDVLVVDIGAEKKKLATAKSSPATATDKKDDAEPEGGWQSFQDYVYGKLKKVRDTSLNYLPGNVLLEFTIDEKGKPTNITVAQAENEDVADKAVQLIEKGPKWKRNSKNKKAKVLIKF